MVAGARLGRLTVGQVGLIADLLRPGEVIRLGLAGRIVIPLAAGARRVAPEPAEPMEPLSRRARSR